LRMRRRREKTPRETVRKYSLHFKQKWPLSDSPFCSVHSKGSQSVLQLSGSVI
jgi:hypothetical protein